jgi:hypothetical protein
MHIDANNVFQLKQPISRILISPQYPESHRSGGRLVEGGKRPTVAIEKASWSTGHSVSSMIG